MLGTFPIKIETCWQEIVVVQIVKLSSIIFIFYFLFFIFGIFTVLSRTYNYLDKC